MVVGERGGVGAPSTSMGPKLEKQETRSKKWKVWIKGRGWAYIRPKDHAYIRQRDLGKTGQIPEVNAVSPFSPVTDIEWC